MPYRYAVYNVQDEARSQAFQRTLDAMEADGWRAHTVNPNFAEICIFWEKAAPSGDAEDAGERKAAAEEDRREHDKGDGPRESAVVSSSTEDAPVPSE